MSSDDLYGYAVRLREAERLIANDPKIRSADKKLILSFLRHIKAKEVGIGRQAKYAFMLMRCAQCLIVRGGWRSNLHEFLAQSQQR